MGHQRNIKKLRKALNRDLFEATAPVIPRDFQRAKARAKLVASYDPFQPPKPLTVFQDRGRVVFDPLKDFQPGTARMSMFPTAIEELKRQGFTEVMPGSGVYAKKKETRHDPS